MQARCYRLVGGPLTLVQTALCTFSLPGWFAFGLLAAFAVCCSCLLHVVSILKWRRFSRGHLLSRPPALAVKRQMPLGEDLRVCASIFLVQQLQETYGASVQESGEDSFSSSLVQRQWLSRQAQTSSDEL